MAFPIAQAPQRSGPSNDDPEYPIDPFHPLKRIMNPSVSLGKFDMSWKLLKDVTYSSDGSHDVAMSTFVARSSSSL